MRCDHMLCVYWKEKHCTLEEISLDSLGACQDCLFIEFDAETIEAFRAKTLARYDWPEQGQG